MQDGTPDEATRMVRDSWFGAAELYFEALCDIGWAIFIVSIEVCEAAAEPGLVKKNEIAVLGAFCIALAAPCNGLGFSGWVSEDRELVMPEKRALVTDSIFKVDI